MEKLRQPLAERLSPRQWVILDVGVATLLAFASVKAVAFSPHRVPAGDSWVVLQYAAAGAACGSLPFRRRFPIPVLCAVAVSVAFLVALGASTPALLAVAMAVYSVAAASIGWKSLATVAGLVGVIELGAVAAARGPAPGAALSGLAVALIGWLAGENTRARRIYVMEVAERAAERERRSQERALRAGAEERMRIARELHDVVAHAMSIIAVRSGVARMALESRPAEAGEALQIIEGTSRQALQELRLLVGVLRSEPEESGADLQPSPGLLDLPELVTQVTQAGVAVAVRVEGDPRRLSPGVDLSAYRIIQEALTNVVRHAGPALAEVTLRYRPAEVVIEVTDDGFTRDRARSPAPANDGAGHGLVGMRERVVLYGGQLVAGSTASGYRVLASLPTDEAGP